MFETILGGYIKLVTVLSIIFGGYRLYELLMQDKSLTNHYEFKTLKLRQHSP